jgi:Rho GTPase-activating protein RGD1
MTISNLSIVFGPTLLNPPPHLAPSALPGVNGHTNGDSSNMGNVATLQNKAIETILEHYVDIFVDDAEE